MSRFFPHAPYAEDQPLSRTILSTHVLFRGFQSGAGVGGIIGAVKAWRAYHSARSLIATTSASSAKPPTLSTASRAIASSVSSAAQPMKTAIVLRSTGTGALIGTGLMVIGLPARMEGRENIEWRDRSWRLLENPGQKEVDDWSAVGTIAGVAAAALTVSGEVSNMSVPRRLLGGAGLGSVVPVAGYMAWRYGVNGGKRQAP